MIMYACTTAGSTGRTLTTAVPVCWQPWLSAGHTLLSCGWSQPGDDARQCVQHTNSGIWSGSAGAQQCTGSEACRGVLCLFQVLELHAGVHLLGYSGHLPAACVCCCSTRLSAMPCVHACPLPAVLSIYAELGHASDACLVSHRLSHQGCCGWPAAAEPSHA